MESLRTSKSIAQSELQQLKETLRRLSAADDSSSSLKLSSLVTPAPVATPKASNQCPQSETPKATSFRSMPTTPPASLTGASNSKAVLSALKALQDKIRRVEDERAALEDDCANLRAQLRLTEAQHATASKKATYELEQVKDATRAAYEALRAERDSLQADVVKARHAHALTTNELEHVQDMLQSYKEKHDSLVEQTAMQDAHIGRLQTEVAEISATSKDKMKELQEALLEATRINKEAARRAATLEEEATRASQLQTTLESRLKDAERTVAQVSQLNEKLVLRMWEAQAAKAKPKPKPKSKPVAPPVTRSTAASRGQSASSAVKPAPTKKAVKKPRAKAAKTNLALLQEANMANVPFLLGTATTPTFSVIGSAQEALRSSELYTAVAPDIHAPAPAVEYKAKAPAAIATDDNVSKVAFLNSMHKAVASVESEFAQLNDRYKALLAQVDKSPDASRHMEETIDALDSKAEQLRLLKQLQAQATKNQLQPPRRAVHSPDAARKKSKALRVLHEYRQLDRHMKNRTADA
ncbi:hypothetical protein ACHHYP_03128 [Achlya hypogyna]|uniref:Uncharacterized protein n=1 Tax=Achlya hypogyna TaxID=1202772 RepID=A0A1V9Z4L4_ACHHY|nr:hypothetical protein ACHHYP_03128 [Achlya hypogyna]